jgi:CheY-like chemotaxis protein
MSKEDAAVGKVLCVEDEAAIREDIVEQLEDSGHEVLQAQDGRQALQMILQHEPDIVISDINMPNMNGAQLLVTLRKNHPEFDSMPFMFLTAFSDRNDVIKGSRLGADDYLTKPVDLELLAVKVEQHLRNAARMKHKDGRDAAVDAGPAADAAHQADVGTYNKAIKNIHNVKVTIIGDMSQEHRFFTDFLSRAGFKVIVFMDEISYLRKAELLPVHFTFLWNYTYQMHRTFIARLSRLTVNNICIRVFPEGVSTNDDYVAIEAINNILKLPVTPQQLEQKLIQLIQEKVSLPHRTAHHKSYY